METTGSRNWIGFWIFGASLNFGYHMMLTAAHDLLKPLDANLRDKFCNPLSTGTFLLSDTIGGVIGIAVAPLVPIETSSKIVLVALLSIISFLITAYSYSETIALLGILTAAFSAGFGEATIMSVSLSHKESVISAYTSGLGAAALLSSGAYLGTTFFFTTRTSLLIMIVVPLIMLSTFRYVIQSPLVSVDKENKQAPHPITLEVEKEIETPKLDTVKRFLCAAPATVGPIFTTSVFRCFINQGLLELVHSHDVQFNADLQYRLFTVIANLGMFVTQSSISCLPIHRLWILPLIEAFLMLLVLIQVLTTSPSFYFMVFLSLAEGMVGGAAIVNTYYRIRREAEADLRPIHMEAAIFANELGAATAGFIAIPSHSAICSIISALRNRKR